MKLDPIQKKHIIEATEVLDATPSKVHSLYWMEFEDGREYQFKVLIRTAYKIATGMDIDDNFQSNEYYRSLIADRFKLNILFKVPGNVPFFLAEELEYFASYAGRPYRKDSLELISAGNHIKQTIFRKTTTWTNLFNLKGWKLEIDNRWQISGMFKSYSWARIYKEKDRQAKVYFTLGVDAYKNALVYKLDCQKKQYTPANALTAQQVKAFERVVNGTEAQWNEIKKTDFIYYNWERLRNETIDFIGKYESLYDEAVKVVMFANDDLKSGNIIENLQEVPPPAKAYNSLPEKKYRFKGAVIDYDAENESRKKIGTGGENLILAREKRFLELNNLHEFADKVRKVKDGEGYDIISFDLNEKKIYIEVKTTTGISTRPFLMSDNEWEFMKRNSEDYFLYRIYDFDENENRGKLYKLSGNIEDIVFILPKQFEIFLKTKDL
jgi:hypothetical protein